MASAVRPAVSTVSNRHPTPALHLGFWSAIACAVTSAGFGVGIVITLFAFKQEPWTGDITAYARNYDPLQMALTVVPSILLALSFLGLVAAVHQIARPENRMWTQLAAMFAVLYAGIVGVNYFLQLSVVRQDLSAGLTEGMSLFAMGNPVSIFWALEILGYFCQGVAAIFMATVFAGGGLAAWVRWMLLAVFITGVVGVAAAIQGIEFANPMFAAGSGAWTLVFPVAMLLCATYFRRHPSIGKGGV